MKKKDDWRIWRIDEGCRVAFVTKNMSIYNVDEIWVWPDWSTSYILNAHLILSSTEPQLVMLVAKTNSFKIIIYWASYSLVSYFETDCSIPVSIKQHEHLIDEDLGLALGHQVHLHDALLAQCSAGASFYEPSEMWNLKLNFVFKVINHYHLNHSLMSSSEYLVFFIKYTMSSFVSFVCGGWLTFLYLPKHFNSHVYIFHHKLTLLYMG